MTSGLSTAWIRAYLGGSAAAGVGDDAVQAFRSRLLEIAAEVRDEAHQAVNREVDACLAQGIAKPRLHARHLQEKSTYPARHTLAAGPTPAAQEVTG